MTICIFIKFLNMKSINNECFFFYKGALVGGICGLGIMGWVTFSAQAAIASGSIV